MKRILATLWILVFLLTACGKQNDLPDVSEQELPQENQQEQSGQEGGGEQLQANQQVQQPDTDDGEDAEEEDPRPQQPAEPPTWEEPYFLRVNCQTNTITVYTQDDDGAYTVPWMAMICSTGENGGTPLGTYELSGNRWEWLSLVGGVVGRYNTQIFGDYLFHSVPYLVRYDKGSLQPGEFDKLGTACSHGCIRLQIRDAMWIYNNLWNIAAVEIYNSPDPGPLGKPTAPQIGESDFPGWDPTDPDEENPWLNVEQETDPEGGTTDPEGGTTDPEGGATDPEGGTTDPEGGTTDPEGGTADPEGGTTDPEGGTTDPEGGMTDLEGGTTEPEGGETDPEDGTAEAEKGKDENAAA